MIPIQYDQLGLVHERSGNANQYSAPAAVFRTGDGKWVTLAGSTNAVYGNNCRAIGRPDLIDDPRFRDNARRVEHAGELNGIFSAWCAAHSLDEVLDAFARAEGTIAPIYSVEQVFADPQMRAREAITRVPDEDFGTVRMQNVVPRFVSEPGVVRHAARALGRDNDEVYGDWLGLSAEERARLAADKVI